MKFKTIKNYNKAIVISVLCLMIILTVILTTSLAQIKTTQSIKIVSGTINYSPSDIEIVAIYIKDGTGYKEIDNVPESGYALNKTNSYCMKNGSIVEVSLEYEYNTKALIITPVTSKGLKCFVYFDEYSITASEQIISLAGNGQVFNEGTAGYRYEGYDVDNYVEFNNETWRILSVVDGSDIGLTSGKYYVKLLRHEAIADSLVWDANETGSWSTSTLYNILNNAYLNKTGDYASTGLSSTARNQIVSAKWYLNGTESSKYTTPQFYNYERANLNNYVTNYVGLMYASDYGYASPTRECGYITLENFSSGCGSNNWVPKTGYRWTLTPQTVYNTLVYRVSSWGDVGTFIVSNTDATACPAVYLRADIEFVPGTTGASDNMFKILE